MFIRRAAAFCALAFLAFIGSAAAQTRGKADLTGNWIAEVSDAGITNGRTNYFRFTLQQSGSELTGTLRPNNQLVGSLKATGELQMRNTWPNGTQMWHGMVKNDSITAVTDGQVPQQIRAYRDTSKPTAPRTHVFEPKEFHRLFSGSIAPALHISPGDTVQTYTVDAGGVDSKGVRRSAGGNPQTGPFYIDGALPGDTIAVHLNRVTLNRDTAASSNTLAANSVDPYFYAGLPGLKKLGAVAWKLDRERGVGTLASASDKMKNYSVALRPMLGCIGVAPPDRMSFRTGDLGPYGGNMDYNRIVEGTTVYLPVFQVGALLFVGDGHAMQGDGELAGNALETSLDVELTVELIRDKSAGWPRAESAEYRMAMGIGGSLNEALQRATTNMARWLQEDYHVDREELTAVLSTAMNYDIAEIVDSDYHVVARISKQTLEGLAH
jgi:acetamidase/formamidase